MNPRSGCGAVPFDRVVLLEAGAQRTLSVEQFLALPLSQRIKVVLERQVTFYQDGAEIDRNVALGSLRTVRLTS